MTAQSLTSPFFSIATPQVLDPFYYRSVVLIVRHEPEGSLGYIINRPTEVTVGAILEDLEVGPVSPSMQDAVCHFGGPVSPQNGTLIYLEDRVSAQPESGEVRAGLGFAQGSKDLSILAQGSHDYMRLYLGYSGWGEGQLELEIERNDWIVAPVANELAFSVENDFVWERALELGHFRPTAFPAWAPPDLRGIKDDRRLFGMHPGFGKPDEERPFFTQG